MTAFKGKLIMNMQTARAHPAVAGGVYGTLPGAINTILGANESPALDTVSKQSAVISDVGELAGSRCAISRQSSESSSSPRMLSLCIHGTTLHRQITTYYSFVLGPHRGAP